MPGTILIVEDDPAARFFLSAALRDDGYEVVEAGSAEEALERMDRRSVDLAVLDVYLPGKTGIELLTDLLAIDPDLPVIFLTGQPDVRDAVQAMKLRACDFLPKCTDLNIIKGTIAHLVKNVQLQREIERLRAAPLSSRPAGGPFVMGKSPRTSRVLTMVDKVARTSSTVLITGESGTGKERIAQLIHAKSDRANKPMVAINCAAIPENLVESELFGSGKGAFTGAVNRIGLIEQADKGTLFLDEIGTLKPEVQAKLLRVLENRTVRRLGETEDHPIDIRLIAASNVDLKQATNDGSFRSDLFYRISVFTIELPPLRERKGDIGPLVAAYIDYFNKEMVRFVEGVTPEALACLEAYSWPGNVRELRNVVERGIILCDGPQIGIEHLPDEIARLSCSVTDNTSPAPGLPLGQSLLDLERRYIQEAIQRANGDLTEAAKILGISEEELRKRLNHSK